MKIQITAAWKAYVIVLIGVNVALAAGCGKSPKRPVANKGALAAAEARGNSKAQPAVPSITMTPNPLGRGPGPHAVTVAWTTGANEDGEVYVSADDAPEELFAQGPNGSKEAKWIQSGVAYQFRLYSGRDHKTELTSVKTKTKGQKDKPRAAKSGV
jgi:hypothetical protein